MYREEGWLKDLKETVGKNAKCNLGRSYEGDGWLTVLPRSQDGTDLSREEFRDALWCNLDLILQDTSLACNSYSNPFTVEHM